MIQRLLFFIALILIGLINKAQDFEVAPVLMNFSAQPGETVKQKLFVRNYGTKSQTYVMKLADFEIDENGKKIVKPMGTSKYSCANWLSINPSMVELNPNQEIEAEVIMSVPPTAEGSRWCQIIVEAAKEKTVTGADKDLVTGLIIVPRIVVVVKYNPKNSKNMKAQLSNLVEITKANAEKRSFKFDIENIGSEIIEGETYLLIANLSTAEEKKMGSKRVTVYPGSKRTIEITLDHQLEPGKYALAAILDCGKKMPIEGIQIMIDQK